MNAVDFLLGYGHAPLGRQKEHQEWTDLEQKEDVRQSVFA